MGSGYLKLNKITSGGLSLVKILPEKGGPLHHFPATVNGWLDVNAVSESVTSC